MKARAPFRKLFTTTSMAALLATGSGLLSTGALAGTTYSSPNTNEVYTGGATDFISIETTLQNDQGLVGLRISGDSNTANNVINSGVIDVSDTGMDEEETEDYVGGVAGIVVTNGAYIFDTINNVGSITVDALVTTDAVATMSESGIGRSARGILVEGDASADGITNSGPILVTAGAHIGNLAAAEKSSSLYADAQAFGVDYTGFNSSFYNAGLIDTRSVASADTTVIYTEDQLIEDTEESTSPGYATGASFVQSRAVGVHFQSPDDEYGEVLEGFTNTGGSGVISAVATATGETHVTVDAQCSVSDEGCFEADEVTASAFGLNAAEAYGVQVGPETSYNIFGEYGPDEDVTLPSSGGFYNNGTISGQARSYTQNTSHAVSSDEDARALSGADEEMDMNFAVSRGIGVSYNLNLFNGDFENQGNLSGEVTTVADAQSFASAPSYAEARSAALADATAKGVELHAMLINGGFTNDGRINGAYNVLIGNREEEGEDYIYTPLSAEAKGGDEAIAGAYASVSASATGIEIEGLSMTDDFRLGYDNSESDGVYATGNLHAELRANAESYAEGSYSGYATAEASAGGDYNTNVAGVEFYVTNLSGQFINEGTVSAASQQYIHHDAGTHSYDEGQADAAASISAQVTGIHIESQSEEATTISGNLYNSGNVSAVVTSVYEGNAAAAGSGYLLAQSNAVMDVTANGMQVDIGELQDNFYNDGLITATANAGRNLVAQSIADRDEEGDTFGDAEAYAGSTYDNDHEESYVSAQATGLDLYLYNVSGHIENEGDVHVSAHADETVAATAVAGDEGDAYALAQSSVWANATGIYIETSGVGTGLEYVDDVDESDGYIYNGGNISVSAVGISTLNASANAIEGSAIAEAVASGSADGDDYANISAYGLVIYGYESAEIAGAIVNEGDIDAQAGINAIINASAYNSGDDTEDNLAAALAGGENGAHASGIDLSYLNIGMEEGEESGFWNGGDVTADASALQSTVAEATSDEGVAVAVIGADISRTDYASFDVDEPNRISADSVGINVYDVYIDGSFSNYATVSALAYAENGNYAHADGQTGAFALVAAETDANAVGLNFEQSQVSDNEEGGGVFNTGLFYGEAIAYGNNEAEADSDDGNATAYIARYDSEDEEYEEYDRLYTSASATGVRMASTYGSDFTNVNYEESSADLSDIFWASSGVVGGFALAQTTNYAHADADEGDALAVVSQQDYAHAAGVLMLETEDGAGSFYNNGAVYAIAGAGDVTDYLDEFLDYGGHHAPEDLSFRQEAYATSDEEAASANVEYSAVSTATGASVWVRDFFNDGLIGAFAISRASTYAHADASDGGGQAYANSDANAAADAVGASVQVSLPGGDVVNTGAILAQAYAEAYAYAKVEGDEDSSIYVDASANADARGLFITASSPIGMIHNEEGASISAYADADADTLYIYNDDEGETEEGYSSAGATALFASGVNFTGLQNDGEISAYASAGSDATAIGLKVEGYNSYSYSGTIVNNGTIEAFARADDPFATAILLTGNARVTSITNTGTISADTEDMSDFDIMSADYGPDIAIDIRGTDIGVQINQNEGEIDGAIVMGNGTIDHIDWKGGEIDGDIFGDYEEDVINIYASTVGDTVYNDFTYDGIIDGADSVSVNGNGHDTAATRLRITNEIRNVASVNVGAMGTLNLGSHATIQTDALNLNAGSTLVFDINDTDEPANGVINTATADLGGATVKAAFVSPWNRTTNEYRIINWEDASDTTFGHVISSDVLTKVTAQYGEDGVDLVMQYLDFGDLTYLEDDATSLGLALDRTLADIDPDSPIGLALAELLQLTPDQFAYEMSQIAGQQTADIQHVTLAQLGSLIHVIQTQINEARNLASTEGGDGLSFSVGSDRMKFSSGEDFKPLGGISAGDPVAQGDWRAWARVFGDWAELKASNTAPGFKSDAAGVVVGADFAPSDGLTLGLAGGYQTSNMKFGGAGKGDIDSWSATAYADYEFGNAYVDGLLGYAAQSYDMDRYLTVLGTSYIANADYDGSSIIGAVEAGYKIAVGGQSTLTPFVGLNSTHTETDGTTETGAGVWNIAYDDRSDTQIDSVLGARLSRDFKTEGGTVLTPTIELGWKHGFGDTSPTMGASMAGIPGSQYTIFGSETKPDTAIVGAALQIQMSDSFDAYVQYNGQYSGDFSENTASLRLRLKF